ncbi:MAG: rod shape-determining protein MreC [Patescibacteria group bacterium]|jgi:rod shape-determining protein MreC
MKNKKIVYILLIIIFICAFIFSGIGNSLKITFKNIFLSPSSITYGATHRIGSYLSLLGSIGKISQENTDLKAQNMALEAEIAKNNQLSYENEQLKLALNFINQSSQKDLLTVKVIGHSPINSLETLEIAGGEKDGISKGSAVISNGYLIGKISEVREKSSTVYLITNVNSLVPVMMTKSRVKGLLRGGISGLVVEQIPLDAEISEGEDVITSSIGDEFPENILVGKVSKIISKESEIFKKVSIDSPVEFNKLDTIFVYK